MPNLPPTRPGRWRAYSGPVRASSGPLGSPSVSRLALQQHTQLVVGQILDAVGTPGGFSAATWATPLPRTTGTGRRG